jgi:hypothetical protein
MVDGCKLSASRSCRFNLEEAAFSNHYIEGWVSPSTGLVAMEDKNNSSTYRELNSELFQLHNVVYWYMNHTAVTGSGVGNK